MHLIPSPITPYVMGDDAQLEQAIVSLAVNAQDAMPDGGVLTIETTLVEVGADEQAPSRGSWKRGDTRCSASATRARA